VYHEPTGALLICDVTNEFPSAPLQKVGSPVADDQGAPARACPPSSAGPALQRASSSQQFRRTARWAVTIVATGVSIFSLDIIATAAGVLLATSDVLDEAPHGVVGGFLAASYLLWALALRVNVTANWRLLEQTGASTNLPSKLLFELARLQSNSQRGPRAASAAGYIATEIAKEAPYYAGAFGAALLSDSVDSTDALVFLAGTNIGAALYEYGLARLSNGFLRRRSRRIR
jgi:hypothetical protein